MQNLFPDYSDAKAIPRTCCAYFTQPGNLIFAKRFWFWFGSNQIVGQSLQRHGKWRVHRQFGTKERKHLNNTWSQYKFQSIWVRVGHSDAVHSETFGLCAYSDSNISEFIRICAYLASNVSERTTQPAIGCATKGVQTVKPYKRHKSTISFSKTSHDMHLRSKTGEELTSSWNKTPLILSFGVSHPKVTIIVTRPFLFDLCGWVLEAARSLNALQNLSQLLFCAHR